LGVELLCQAVSEKANIVPVFPILPAWITQPDDETLALSHQEFFGRMISTQQYIQPMM
jgi:hypothetical protein